MKTIKYCFICQEIAYDKGKVVGDHTIIHFGENLTLHQKCERRKKQRRKKDRRKTWS